MHHAGMKTCLDCQQTKPFEDFPPAKKRSDGRGSYCRQCMRERSKASYRGRQAVAGKAVRERPVLPPGQKRCPDCGVIKPFDEFAKSRNGKDGLHSYCKPCHNARGKET